MLSGLRYADLFCLGSRLAWLQVMPLYVLLLVAVCGRPDLH